ncbi:MAG: GNAT family N-acetyltransferase [Balneolaceae bacterium]
MHKNISKIDHLKQLPPDSETWTVGSVGNPLSGQRPEQLNVKTITTEGQFDALKPQWIELADKAESHVFQTFQWSRTWWKHFGKKGQLNILLFFDGDKLAGIAPLFRDTVEWAGIEITSCLRFLGSNVSQPKEEMIGLISYTDYLDFIIVPGYERAVTAQMLRYLKGNRLPFDEILLENISETSGLWGTLISTLQNHGIPFIIDESTSSQLINTSQTWEEYLASLDNGKRYKARLHWKRANKTDRKVFDIKEAASGEEAGICFEQLVKMHQKKWNRIGSLGTFYEKSNYEFHKEITRKFFEEGWLQLKLAIPVEKKNACAAIDLNYRYKNRIYCIHRAVDDESPFYSKGPGNVLLNVILEEATRGQTVTYDFMRGNEYYKRSVADETIKTRSISIESTGKWRMAKSRVIKKIIYFKRRISRKLKLLEMMLGDKTVWTGTREFMSLLTKRLTA